MYNVTWTDSSAKIKSKIIVISIFSTTSACKDAGRNSFGLDYGIDYTLYVVFMCACVEKMCNTNFNHCCCCFCCCCDVHKRHRLCQFHLLFKNAIDFVYSSGFATTSLFSASIPKWTFMNSLSLTILFFFFFYFVLVMKLRKSKTHYRKIKVMSASPILGQ